MRNFRPWCDYFPSEFSTSDAWSNLPGYLWLFSRTMVKSFTFGTFDHDATTYPRNSPGILEPFQSHHHQMFQFTSQHLVKFWWIGEMFALWLREDILFDSIFIIRWNITATEMFIAAFCSLKCPNVYAGIRSCEQKVDTHLLYLHACQLFMSIKCFCNNPNV